MKIGSLFVDAYAVAVLTICSNSELQTTFLHKKSLDKLSEVLLLLCQDGQGCHCIYM